jgi:large subunit ribosomal protein L10
MGDGPALQSREVERLATLPPREQIVGQLLSQLQSPIYRLLYVLNGPLWNFGGLLQARIQQLEAAEAGS